MAIFKCKMCGGTIEFNPGDTVGTCDSCGTKQTLPRLDDDKKVNLYDRANHFRRNNDYDKAMGIYEQILNEDSTDAEAYWSLVLCRYGIEYVEDPATHKRVPTVNRAQFTSIFDDDNYKSALKYADLGQKAIYEEEAKTINEIQKGILAISQKEEPFDVFICYKETDNNGRRTQDSVLANDLYHQLTQEGFKVFFSRITLEDKLGTAYEPYIFAALNSAKVMVVIGTKAEYFNAVWVKNEWSRYLSLIRNDAKKVLIPAYRDMDPYDLPDEFAHLQAQDMSKLGFMQDLIRGIKKIIGEETPKEVAKETVIVKSDNANIAPLLKRAFMFLEDGEWSNADAYCEKILDMNPECSKAYIGKLMAEKHISKEEYLKDCNQTLETDKNYQKAVRFAEDNLKNKLISYNTEIAIRMDENSKALKPFMEYLNDKNCPIKISFRENITCAINAAGKVFVSGKKINKDFNVSNWENIKSVSCEAGRIIGVKANGTIITTGSSFLYQRDNQKMKEWKNIVQVESGNNYTIGLRTNGTVVARGQNENGQCNVSNWNDIVMIDCGRDYTVGLKNNGQVVAKGNNEYGQCNVKNWSNLVAISCGACHTIGLKSDGTVFATGSNDSGQCNVNDWRQIVAISCGDFHTVGLKSDGTVVATGFNYNGQCDVSDWKNIVGVFCGGNHTAGIREDGTTVGIEKRWKLFNSLEELADSVKIKNL